MENRANLWEPLRRDVYTQPALVPISPWLDSVPPAKPKIYTGQDGSGKAQFTWEKDGDEPVWLWLVQTKTGADWTVEILPAQQTRRAMEWPRYIAVSAVDRCGNASTPCVLELREDRAVPK
jgi:hypothetical protein